MTDWTSNTPSRIVWGQVKAQPEAADGGIDFEYQLRGSYPMLLSETGPFLLLSSISEGSP